MKRSFLTALGLEKEVINQIMDEHGASVELIKEKSTEAAEKEAEKLNRKIAALQETIDNAPKTDGEDWKSKYDDEVKAHADTKSAIEAEKTLNAKRTAAKAEFMKKGVNEKVFDDFMGDKLDYDKLEFDGAVIKNADEYVKSYQERYADYFGKTETIGTDPATPPTGGGISTEITKEQFSKMSYNERNKLFTEDKPLYDKLKGE